jgi:predicted HTH domain antitoxin
MRPRRRTDDRQGLTEFDVIASELGVSRQRAAQLVEHALRRAREELDRRRIDPSMFFDALQRRD